MTNTTLDSFLDIAYPICLEIPRQKKHVSLVVYKNRIISIGINHFKTHPKSFKLGYQFAEMHSELDAYRKIPKQLLTKKLTLINARFNRFGDMRMSKPCAICNQWCSETFHEMYYTTDNGIERM